MSSRKPGFVGRSVLAALAVAILAGGVATAQPALDPAKAKRFVLDGVARSMMVFRESDPTPATVARRVRGELEEKFDVGTIAAYALGPLRTKLDAVQKQRYLTEFKEWVAGTVTRFVIGLRKESAANPHDMITIKGTTPIGPDQILVHSRIGLSGAEAVQLDWRLRSQGSRFQVLDVIVGGVSHAELFGSQVAALIRSQKGDINGMIAQLERKNTPVARN